MLHIQLPRRHRRRSCASAATIHVDLQPTTNQYPRASVCLFILLRCRDRRCPMTWYPLQAALKMSTIPGAIRATLDTLLDHINPDPQDPRQPDTLTVWESR